MKAESVFEAAGFARRLDWARMSASEREQALARPPQPRSDERAGRVAEIIAGVAQRGDAALREYSAGYDGCSLSELRVSQGDIDAAVRSLPAELKQAINEAHGRIQAFHQAGMRSDVEVETAPGVRCKRILRPIAPVGLYVPAGTAPLPSTALMLGVPAQLAGCKDIVLCTPPAADGRVDAATLHAASLCGITRIYRLGGVQAIAGMALGTESLPRCAKLFGPGSAWVAEAKRQVAQAPDGPAIDLQAGPSELLVIADAQASALRVAADLLSQAEHGPDSQVILLSDTPALITAVEAELKRQMSDLPRAEIAAKALACSRLIQVSNLDEAMAISNRYAPEHLILQTAEPSQLLSQVEHAGSVFLGAWAPESVGDYCSGTNHVLPTGGQARTSSGLSVESFQKAISVQTLSAQGLAQIGPCAITLARAEGLEAHARAVELRLQQLSASSAVRTGTRP